MNVLEFTLLVWLGGFAAGLLGSLTGLGGSVVIVPLLTLVFGVDIRYALGASLISVIAASSGAASAYVKEGYSNIRIGMFLEIATTAGAIAGASSTTILPPGIVRNIRAFKSCGIIQLGLLVLVATPIVRVILSVAAFVWERDLLYVIATLTVLGILLYSLLVRGR